MKLNLILFTVFIGLLGGAYFLFEKDSQLETSLNRQENYLLPIDSLEAWALKTQRGVLSFKNNKFFWNNGQELGINDEKLIDIFTRLRDLKIVDSYALNKDRSWAPVDQIGLFIEFNAFKKNMNWRTFHIGSLNQITGRMKVLDTEKKIVYIIDDESTLKKPYKSFEIGQRIKYTKLLKTLKETQWN